MDIRKLFKLTNKQSINSGVASQFQRLSVVSLSSAQCWSSVTEVITMFPFRDIRRCATVTNRTLIITFCKVFLQGPPSSSSAACSVFFLLLFLLPHAGFNKFKVHRKVISPHKDMLFVIFFLPFRHICYDVLFCFLTFDVFFLFATNQTYYDHDSL